MSLLQPLHRRLLVDQVAAALRSEIASGRWRQWMPSERSLVRSLSVSRDTVRGALRQLVENRELSRVPRQGYRVGVKPSGQRSAGPAAGEVGLVCPEQIYSMPTYVIQVVDILRGMCAEAGLHFELFEGPRFARRAPEQMMADLARSHPKACWIPIMADRRLQEWFVRTGTPVVLYGNVYPDLTLPGVGIDYRACIRHAANALLYRGHRSLALVTYDPRRAGEEESLSGFREALAEWRGEPCSSVVVARPDDDVRALSRQVDRLFRLSDPPTGMVVCRTHHYATVATHLAELGRKVPADVSLICRGEDAFLRFLSPLPACYRVNVESLARALFRCVLRVAGGAAGLEEQHRVMPELVMGASLGAVRTGIAELSKRRLTNRREGR
ncbi:MAG TPA: substrate-binding domain-containing protein [Opitutaceae bacterium]|nr:substrate-binding domain-containing protein [Opitutaceae bacterium]